MVPQCCDLLTTVVCCRLPPTEDMKSFVIFKHLFISLECLTHGWKGTALGRMSGSNSVTQRDREALAKHDPVGEISAISVKPTEHLQQQFQSS